MDREEAITIHYGEGGSKHNRLQHGIRRRLEADAVLLRAPSYYSQSAQATHQGEVLADICEALNNLLNRGWPHD